MSAMPPAAARGPAGPLMPLPRVGGRRAPLARPFPPLLSQQQLARPPPSQLLQRLRCTCMRARPSGSRAALRLLPC